MIKQFNSLKSHLLADNFFREIFYIDRDINGLSFFISVILRMSFILFLAETISNDIIIIPVIFYFSYNTLKWRIKAVYGKSGLGTTILSVIWTIAFIYFIKYMVFVFLYFSFFDLSQNSYSFPFFDQGKVIITSLGFMHSLSFLIFILSVIILSLYKNDLGRSIYLSHNNSYYSQRKYLDTHLRAVVINIGFLIVFFLLSLISTRRFGLWFDTRSVALNSVIFLWSVTNLIIYFYNTSSRLKDFSVSRLWVLLLYIVTGIGLFSSPVASLGAPFIVSKFGDTELLIAYNTYIRPLIDLVTRPLYHVSLIVYFILLFIPGRKHLK